MILPEIGGRIHVGQDATNGYNFFYRQRVIKPALVGLLGPWISGGVEFNWPQHHRPLTFMPVDWSIEEAEDGSRTVWLVFCESAWQNAIAFSQLTNSTGQVLPVNWLGFLPITAWYCSCVTS